MGCKVKVPRLFVLDIPAFCCCASLQNATSDMYITVDGDVSVVGTGSEPVYCTGPFAGNNVHLSSNTGKMLYISSSIIVMYDLTVGSDGGAPVTIKNIVEVGVDAGNPLNLWVLLHKLHKSTHYRLTRPNHLTLALSLSLTDWRQRHSVLHQWRRQDHNVCSVWQLGGRPNKGSVWWAAPAVSAARCLWFCEVPMHPCCPLLPFTLPPPPRFFCR